MALYQWTNADGNGAFGDQYNWINTSASPPYGVPGADDIAIVNIAGTVTGSGTVDELVLDGNGGLLTANLLGVTAQTLVLGGNVSLTGTFSFSGSTGPVATQEIVVTGGTTTVGTGSDVNFTASSTATATTVGLDVGMASGDTAVLNVTGLEANAQVLGGNMVLGDSGTGNMTISDAGYLKLEEVNNSGSGQLILGNAASGQGNLLATGPYSTVYAGGAILVGEDGIGRLTIAAGAAAVINYNQNIYDPIWVGYGSGSNGALLVTGAGSRLIDANAYGNLDVSTVGWEGTGALTVANGASVELGQLDIGELSGGKGSVIVEGAGSLLQLAGNVYLGGDETIGSGGSGALSVISGALATDVGNGVFCVGGGNYYKAGAGSGAVSVSGTGSTLNTGATTVEVGWLTTGRMTVSTGGTVISAGYNGTPAAYVGYEDTGAVTINGAGANWVATGEIEVGDAGTGSVLVEAGGALTSGDGTYGLVVGGSAAGTAEITGTGSHLTNSGDFVIGDGSAGLLYVLAGGSVSTTLASGATGDGAILGDVAGGSGKVLVSGAGSSWSIGTDLVIGDAGTGALYISAGGRVTAASLVTAVSAAAGLNVSGTGSDLAVSGTAQFGGAASAGVSIGAGGVISVGGNTVLRDAVVSLAGGTLSAGTTLTVDGGNTITGNGKVAATSLVNAGTMISAAGTLGFIGAIAGTGRLDIGTASSLSLSGAVGAGQTAAFTAATGTLQLATPASFAATIADFAKGDVIDLGGIVASSLSFSGHTLTVHESNGASLGLLFSGTYTSASFAAPVSDGHGGSYIMHT